MKRRKPESLFFPPARAADDTALTPFKEAGAPPAPWHVVGLPGQDPQVKPFTTFSVVELDGRKALRVDAKQSFGNLVNRVKWTAPARSWNRASGKLRSPMRCLASSLAVATLPR